MFSAVHLVNSWSTLTYYRLRNGTFLPRYLSTLSSLTLPKPPAYLSFARGKVRLLPRPPPHLPPLQQPDLPGHLGPDAWRSESRGRGASAAPGRVGGSDRGPGKAEAGLGGGPGVAAIIALSSVAGECSIRPVSVEGREGDSSRRIQANRYFLLLLLAPPALLLPLRPARKRPDEVDREISFAKWPKVNPTPSSSDTVPRQTREEERRTGTNERNRQKEIGCARTMPPSPPPPPQHTHTHTLTV